MFRSILFENIERKIVIYNLLQQQYINTGNT